jgi:nucleotide-binding universal stress UspA family protein
MPAEEIARLGASIAIALHDLHRQDVVHLDLKPTNIVFRPSGEAVLIDFGLAHHGHYPDLLAEELRMPVGNWVYMAPEQIFGVRNDPRSDVYALGGILYELATGRMPFGHPQSVAELRRRLYRDPIPPRALVPRTPEWLQEVLLRCLETDASKRYASAGDLAHALANPDRIEITERGSRRRRGSLWQVAQRRFRSVRFEPAPPPPPLLLRQPARVIAVAIAPQEGNERLRTALRDAARGAIAANDGCRVACITVVPPAATLSGEGDENSATGRHIRRLVDLRGWARALALPEERLTFHVLESEKPSVALVDFIEMNDVEQLLIGAPGSGSAPRRFAGVCAQVVAAAPCTVTVVRARLQG